MAKDICPTCGHPWLTVIHVCNCCGTRYCSYCNDNNRNPGRMGNDCPHCGHNNFHDEEVH